MNSFRLLVLGLNLLAAALPAPGQTATGRPIGKPLYATHPVVAPAGSPSSDRLPITSVATVPYWSGSFQVTAKKKRKDFPFTMVGTDPGAGSATTVIPATIIPLSVSFSNGTRLDGSTRVQNIIASPVFQPFDSQAGFTQYADAMYRASFFKLVSEKSPNWHVLLGQPAVLPTQYLVVPAAKGLEFTGSHSGAAVGLIDSEWFTGQLQQLIRTLKLDPRALTVFLTDNTFLFAGNPGKCCIVGFHSGLLSSQATAAQLHTFVWASYNDPKTFDVPLEDITALSHEIAEWYSDPFLSNVVPAWAQPGSSACSAEILEVGDPIQAFRKLSFAVMLDGTLYHPQDSVLFSWFARQSPSIGIKGRYSYRGDKLFAPAPPCS